MAAVRNFSLVSGQTEILVSTGSLELAYINYCL